MFIKDVVIALTWDLEPTAVTAAYNSTYYDLQITEPDGVVSYTEGEALAPTFVAPSSSVAGTLDITYTFLKAGLYQLSLCTGAAAGTTVLAKRSMLIVESDTAQRIAVSKYV